jgi:hypothetical protein
MPVIPAPGRLRQEDQESKASLSHIARPCHKQGKRKRGRREGGEGERKRGSEERRKE